MKRFLAAILFTLFGLLLFLTGIGFSQSESPRTCLPIVFTTGLGQSPTPTATLNVPLSTARQEKKPLFIPALLHGQLPSTN